MTEELFGERRRALEEEFFKRQTAELLAAMRAKAAEEQVKNELRNTTGIADDRVLSDLLAAGMTPAALTAAALVPLVSVAWADGRLQEVERNQILRYARTLELADAANALLTDWLSAEPDQQLFDTWLEYVRGLLPQLDPAVREDLKTKTCARAAAVAEAAAGEPYGVGRQVSPEERQVLQRIEAAFEG